LKLSKQTGGQVIELRNKARALLSLSRLELLEYLVQP